VNNYASYYLPAYGILAYKTKLDDYGKETRERGDMILVYKILNKKFVISNQLIVKAPASTTRGHNQKLLKTIEQVWK